MTQYLACKFREEDTRTYTYHFDGDETLDLGTKVLAEGRNGATQTVIVVMALDEAPAFPTKAIMGKKPEEGEETPDNGTNGRIIHPDSDEGRRLRIMLAAEHMGI